MIQKVTKGQSPTLLDAEKANELIEAVNALQNMRVVRGGTDYFSSSNTSCVLTLSEHTEQSEQEGGSIDAEIVEMWVCVNGTAVKKKFYVET